MLQKYAASAMNELLSWYGYEKVDEREAQGLQLRPPGVAPPPGAAPTSRKRAKLRARTKTPPSDDESSDSDAAAPDRLRPRPPASPPGTPTPHPENKCNFTQFELFLIKTYQFNCFFYSNKLLILLMFKLGIFFQFEMIRRDKKRLYLMCW